MHIFIFVIGQVSMIWRRRRDTKIQRPIWPRHIRKTISSMVTRIGYTLSFGGYLGHLAVFFGVITVIVFSLVLHLIGRIQLLFERASYDLNEPFMASVSEVGMQFAAGLMKLARTARNSWITADSCMIRPCSSKAYCRATPLPLPIR